MSTSEPLWRVMTAAYANAMLPEQGHIDELRCGCAAELRAIADWLVPEEDPEPLPLEEQIAWVARSNLRHRLLSEADRAEAGE